MGDLKLYDAPRPAVWSLAAGDTSCLAGRSIEIEIKFGGPTTLGAGDTHLLGPASLTEILSPEIEAEIVAGRAAIYLHGEIAYFVKHLTKFRLFYRGNGTAISSNPVALVTAPEGNDSD